MCGIFGYIGKKNGFKVCIEGLKKLEYRGYDSSGIAGIQNGEIVLCKEVGNVAVLEKAITSLKYSFPMAIAHTRWATHGKPDKKNAHPQLDQTKKWAVVHNGVIENYTLLRDRLIKEHNISFTSETDTEVIAQLVAIHGKNDFFTAVQKTIGELEGSFALAFIQQDHPDEILAVAEKSPLIVGYSKESKESFLASDPNALVGTEMDFYFLSDGEIAHLKKEYAPAFFNKRGEPITKEPSHQFLENSVFSKEQFEHYMIKEIFEQEHTIKDAMLKRLDVQGKATHFEELDPLMDRIREIDNIVLIGCGTSWHAAFIASYFFEAIAHISTKAEIASEYRYKYPIVHEKTLIIALSQSGETADTLAAMRAVRGKNTPVIALCNVPGSTLAREADATIFLHAKQEIAVASTKTFTSQLTILYMLALFLAKKDEIAKSEMRLYLKYLYEMPIQLSSILTQAPTIQKLAKKYAKYNDFFFLGRGVLYPTALESALKLKEIAYINASGYPAGEMKHGPIALLNENFPVAILCANKELQQKIMSDLMESRARGAPIIVFGWQEFEKEILPVADDVIWIPKTTDMLACIPITVVSQLFAYYMAKERGCPIDQPRNLAKSVTVE